MLFVTRAIIYLAMVLLGIVSMWTTYVSLHDSILPEPLVRFNLGGGVVWNCSIFALGLSMAIGMMLFALKVAVIDEQKRLNLLGVVGMTVIAFISISFNLDVLYRTADRDFFVRYSTEKMKSTYENFLTNTQKDLLVKRDAARKVLARQEGELDAEVKGLRTAPQGYGKLAKQEDYQLTVLQKTTAVELEAVEDALSKKEAADTLLRMALPKDIDALETLQNELRVVVKDLAAAGGVAMPAVVRTESPLFAVFEKLSDIHTIGIKEIFFLIIAFFLDLGDIIGYALIPNKSKKETKPGLQPLPEFVTPSRVVLGRFGDGDKAPAPFELPEDVTPALSHEDAFETEATGDSSALRRPFTFRRR